ncbi:MAG: adenosine kinase [Candidatus Latescibacteria bacterium]|nr:adenosine kinase [Candidatus Latescibacterota bacterium]
MSRSFDVYGLGHALVDVQYTIAPERLGQLGIRKGVMTLIDEAQQAQLLQALDGSARMAQASGGSAANTMIGVASFGGKAYYTCLIGRDEWGDFYHRDLEKAGVQSNPEGRAAGPTGKCVVLITPDADRTLNTFLGVSSQLAPEHVEAAILGDSAHLYLEGYLVSSDNGFAACLHAQQLGRQAGTRISLTLSDPAMVEFFRARFEQLVAGGVDLLFCNEAEARTFTGASDARAAAAHLATQVGAGCITCGAAGALIFEKGHTALVPGFSAQAVDTTGAGDLFAGGVLFGLAKGHTLAQAARLGNYAAAQVVAQYGPRLAHPLHGEADQILAAP